MPALCVAMEKKLLGRKTLGTYKPSNNFSAQLNFIVAPAANMWCQWSAPGVPVLERRDNKLVSAGKRYRRGTWLCMGNCMFSSTLLLVMAVAFVVRMPADLRIDIRSSAGRFPQTTPLAKWREFRSDIMAYFHAAFRQASHQRTA